MHPSFAEDLVRERIDELWRLADRSRREHVRELRARRPKRLRPAFGRQLRRIGSRLASAGSRIAGDEQSPAIDCR